jgi:hypothetical protein
MGDRLLRWMPPALVLVLFGWVAARAARPVSDPDDWWHLRLGNDLISQHSLAAPAHWSAYATLTWVPTEPLPEIAAAYVDRGWGLPGLAVLYAASALVVVLTVYLTSRRFASALPGAVTTVLVVLTTSASLSARPQLVSFVLLSVVVTAWLRTEQDHRVRWWLVPVVWMWSLCHGFWFIGAGYGVLFVAGFALGRRMPRPVLLRQAALAVASVAVVGLSPVGLGVLEAPFAVNSTAQYLQEWQRTDLTSPSALGATAMFLVVAGTWLASRREVTWPRVLVLASAVLWTWYAGRTVAVAGVVMAPLCAVALERLVHGGEPQRTDQRTDQPIAEHATRVEVVGLAVAAALATALVAVLAPTTSDRPGDVPLALDAQLDRLPAGSGVFNDYALGGWISWRHPDLEQYIDGLITPYSVSHVRGFALATSMAPGWYRVVRDSGAPVALLAQDSALATGLTGRGWVTLGSDAGYVLLARPGNPADTDTHTDGTTG